MDQLRFTAVHEDGQHLVLESSDGTEVLLPIDERLRAALRPRGVAADTPATQLRPRDVQAMIRAGQSPADVAEITGWPADRVARFEAPILAEREHVAGLARAAHVRGRDPEGGISTLESRVRERLSARGVDADNTGWDATRPEGGTWTVLVTFVAGQRQRSAAWRFDPADRTVDALDDEARWLSEDEQSLPGSATGRELLGGAGASEEVDLMTSMRERSRSRGRRKKPSTSRTDPAGLPELDDAPEQVLPLEDLPYDPETMGLPPAAHAEAESVGDGAAGDGAADDRAGDDGPAGGDRASEGSASQDSAGKDTRGKGLGRRRSRSRGPEDTAAASATTATPGRSDQGAGAVAEDASPVEAAAPTYDIEFDFDEADFDVDPSPQDATLADLFGPGVDQGGLLDDEVDDEVDDEDDELEDDLEDASDEEAVEELAAEELDDEPLPVEDADDAKDTPESEVPGAEVDAPAAATGDDAEDDTEAEVDTEAEDDTPTPAQDHTKRRKDGRPGVPSWDDIMFGAKDRGR